jgi:hypothetical protein
MSPRKAPPVKASVLEQRAANRAAQAAARHAAPAHRAEHAEPSALKRLYQVISNKRIFGHTQGQKVELSEAEASLLVQTGHIIPVDDVASEAPAVEPVETGDAPESLHEEDDEANSAE